MCCRSKGPEIGSGPYVVLLPALTAPTTLTVEGRGPAARATAIGHTFSFHRYYTSHVPGGQRLASVAFAITLGWHGQSMGTEATMH